MTGARTSSPRSAARSAARSRLVDYLSCDLLTRGTSTVIRVVGIELHTVVSFALLSAASWMTTSRSRTRRLVVVGVVFAGLAALVSAVTLVEHLASIDLWIDRGAEPGLLGRMGGNTALLCLCLGAGLALGPAGGRWARRCSDASV